MRLNVQYIKDNLYNAGMRVQELAYLCDVSSSYMSNLLNCKEVPSTEMVKKLMVIFDTSYKTITVKGNYRKEELLRGNKNNKIDNNKLTQLIDNCGLTQREVADLFKNSESYISLLCTGKECPSDMALAKICVTFDIHPNDILVNKISETKAKMYTGITSW